MSARVAVRSAIGALTCSVIFMFACSSKPAGDGSAAASSPQAAAPAVAKTAAAPADSKAASAPPAISVSGAVTTITGVNDQVTSPVRLETGAYLFTWTSTGAFASPTVKDANDKTLDVLSLGGSSGESLFTVDNDQVKAGDVKVEMSALGAWTLKIEKVDGSNPAALPQALSGEERSTVISKPFALAAGTIAVSYTYKNVPKGTGTLFICNVSTGQPLSTRMMPAGRASGNFDVKVPEAGAYIARTIFPLASGGGEVKITQ